MSNRFKRLRKWANKDDGRYFQIGNENIHWPEALATLSVIFGICVLALNRTAQLMWLRIVGWISICLGATMQLIQTRSKLK